MDQQKTAAAVGTCKHLAPFLEQALSEGARVTGVEQGYSEVRQVVRISNAAHFVQPLPEPIESFESNDRHYRSTPEAGLACRNCRQALAWDR
jgi:hypothetical protein